MAWVLMAWVLMAWVLIRDVREAHLPGSPRESTRTSRRPGRSGAWGGVVAAVAGLILVLASLTGCSGAGDGTGVTVVDVGNDGSAGALRGTELPEPIDKPALNLVGTDGQPFDLRERTAGKVTLVFFGFTNCPDVCPTTMADIASALSEVGPEVSSQVAVVFVTADPERDTGEVLDRWLGRFDETFIGVTGTLDRIHAEAERLGVALAAPERQPDGRYLVTHGSQVIAFTKDDKSRVAYLAGTQVKDYIHDLPILTGGGANA